MIKPVREARSRLVAWSRDEPSTHWLLRQLQTHLRVILSVATTNIYTRIHLHAQALALKTLLAIVPLLVVMFAIFKGFGGLQAVQYKVEEFLLRNLASSDELRSLVRDRLLGFLDALDGEAIGAVSAIILVFTVLSLLNNIDNSINTIFGVAAQRPWIRRFVIYWAVVTLGPLLLGASLTLTTALQIDAIRRVLQTLPGASQLVIGIAPLVITWLAFTAVYAIVPSVQVRLRSAFHAGLIAGTSWNLFKFAYAFYASNAVTVHTIYGSLAAIPLFILWVWLSWLCVLYGAQLTYAYDNPDHKTEDHDEDVSMASAWWELAYARVFATIARDFEAGTGPTDEVRLAGELEIPPVVTEQIIETLTDYGLVNRVQPQGLAPGREPKTVALSDVINTFHQRATRSASQPAKDALDRELEAILGRARESSQRVLGQIDYTTLLERFPYRSSNDPRETLAPGPPRTLGEDVAKPRPDRL